MIRFFGAVFFFGFFPTTFASAATVNLSFTGIVVTSEDTGNSSTSLPIGIERGDTVSGVISYETEPQIFPNSTLTDLERGQAVYDDGVALSPSVSLSFGDTNIQISPSGSAGTIARFGIANNSEDTLDGVSVLFDTFGLGFLPPDNDITDGERFVFIAESTTTAPQIPTLTNDIELPIGPDDVDFSASTSSVVEYSLAQDGNFEYSFELSVDPDSIVLSSDVDVVEPEQLSFERSRDYNINTNNPVFQEDQPTIILTHGRQPNREYNGLIDRVPDLEDAYNLIEENYGEEVNIIAVTWEGAFFDATLGVGSEDLTMVSDAERAGRALGEELTDLFDLVDYDGVIHFIGHSYGTVVNREAALRLTSEEIDIAQFTLLDAPINAPLAIGGRVERGLAPLIRDSRIEYIESYYGTQPTAGIVLGGAIEFTARDNGYVYDADHVEVFQDYINTIPTLSVVDGVGGFFLSPAIDGFSFLRPDDGRGFFIDFSPAIFRTEEIIASSSASSFDPITQILQVGSASDGYLVFDTLIPDNAFAVSFDLVFDRPGDGDFLELQFGDELLAVFDGDVYQNQSNVTISVLGLGGRRDLMTFFLANAGGLPSSLSISNFRYVTEGPEIEVTPVPLPANLALLFTGLASLGMFRRFRRR